MLLWTTLISIGLTMSSPLPSLAVGDQIIVEQEIITLEGPWHQVFQDTLEKSREHADMVARFITARARG